MYTTKPIIQATRKRADMYSYKTKSLASIGKVAAAALLIATPVLSQAVDIGPFVINGFVKIEAGRTSNVCEKCQAVRTDQFGDEDRHRPWADAIAPGKPFGTQDGVITLAQPYIGTKDFNLGKGFKVRGLWSQRWRDGKVDIEGFEYEKNITFTQEDYGSLQLGAFPTRGWSIADYPYGTQIGVADAWASSGSGYGLLTRAIRYGAPKQYVFGGDLQLEATYDFGASGYYHKPQFLELFAQYAGGPWVIEGVVQHAKNGKPSAWTHGPFTGMTNEPGDDKAAGPDNQQSIVMVMARYKMNAKTVLFAGLRHNEWSGARAHIVGNDGTNDLWNSMFNVGLSGPGVLADPFTAYPAQSEDISAGFTYKISEKVTMNAGLVYLGKARTDNPSERGQSNTMTLGALGLGYEIMPGWSVYGYAGAVNYGQKGLAPLSVPGHSSFSGIDPRVATNGKWLGLGTVYVF